jgi:tetraacyldisaccharide 4'-kinase
MINFFEKIYYETKWYHYFFILALLPFSLVYATINLFKAKLPKKDFNIKIISIGNLIVGGSGKTPFAIELIKFFGDKKVAYISRGYGRKTKGLIVVKKDNKILCNVNKSGDEAMLVAKECDCIVIVSENRSKAINLAKKMGVDLIILDDAFLKPIKKFDILLEPKTITNFFPLPSGPFREFYFAKNRADLILKEDKDYKRVVTFNKVSEPLLLVTAIANANRLNKFLPKNVVAKLILSDHSYFNKKDILDKMAQVGAKKIITTQKDYVKLEDFKLPTIILKLQLQIKKQALQKIKEYVVEK